MSTISPPDPDPRSVATFELSTIIPMQGRLLDEHAASFRWLVASLFAANGGGIIAVAGSEKLTNYGIFWASTWFGTGILFSLLCAWFNQRVITGTLPAINALIAFWARVAHGMDFDDGDHQNLLNNLTNSAKRGWYTQASGWLATLAFVFGMTAAGTNLRGQTNSLQPQQVSGSQ